MKTILWLEDDAFFVKKLMRPFEEEGYELKIYETASAFLDDIALAESSSLVVIDLLVPSRSPDVTYGGLEVLKVVSGLPRVPPLLVFSVVFVKNVESTIQKYTRNFIQKPVRLKEFTAKVRALLAGEGSAPEARA